MPLKYRSGEEILQSDIVRLHGVDGTIEIVADPENPTPDTEWYIREFGGG
jgi:hypothetical protein